MVNKKKDKKNIIIIVCVIVAIIIIALIAILANNRGPNQLGGSDAFFVSDGTKYVIPIKGDRITIDEEEPMPEKAYLVYYYTDNNITEFKTYQEYIDNETAKSAYNYLMDIISDSFEEISLDGRYVVITHKASDYEGITAKDVQRQVEYLEQQKSDEEAIEEETTEEEPVEEDPVEEESTETTEETTTESETVSE